jgi:hypothetical protein
VVEVRLGQGDPTVLELDTDGTPIQEDRLDDGRTDAGERVKDHLAGC